MSSSSSEKLDPHVIKVASVLIVGTLAVVFDTTIVSVALHTLTIALHSSVSVIQWVTTGYLLALAITVPLSAWAQRRFGGKNVWMFALAVFLVGSIASSLAWDASSLIAFRVIQGAGGGLMLPVLQTLIVQAAGGKLMGRTISIVALPALLGPILGPVVGGLIVTNLDWQWMFWVNVPFCVVGLILAWRLLDPTPAHAGTRFDWWGFVLLSPGLAALILALSNLARSSSFARGDVLVPLVAGVVLVGGFGLYAMRTKRDPLVKVRLLGKRPVGSSSAVLFLSGFALYGAMLLLPLYWQEVRGTTALAAGLLLVPQGVGTLASRSLAGRLTDRIGARTIAVIGFVMVAAATIPFAFVTTTTNEWYLMGVLVVRGLGLGAVTIPVMTVAFQGLDASDIAHSSVLTRIAQQVGGSFGTAILAVALQRAIAAHAGAGAAGLADAFQDAFWWSVGFTGLAVALCFLLPASARRTSAASAAPVSPASASATSRE